MIDAAHQNENTSTDPGTYKNNLTAFTKLVQREGYTVVENKQPLTADLLKDVAVLVITHPRVDLTADKNKAVADFVKNGGSLFMTDKSNYNNNTNINNDLLQEMGATIQINNDGINDDTKDGNFWSDPLKSKFAVRIHLHPVSNFITDRADTLEYYSGSSLEKIGHQPLTDSDTVTILASGNETTYQGSVAADNYVYDNVSDNQGGSVIPAVASKKVGKGRIVVSGMNFVNDKQLDESFNPKGNDELGINAINWLANRGTTIISISDARNLPDDTNVTVEGTVTSAAGVFFDAFYLQDETGGIMAFNEVPEGTLKAGDKVRVYGHLKTFENNKELEFTKFTQDVIKIGTTDPVLPKLVTTGEATSDANKGLLVKVKGKVVSKYDDNSYVINDGSGDLLVFTDGYIVNQSGPVPVLKTGDTLEAVGFSGSFAQGDRIRVRDTKEMIGAPADVDNSSGTPSENNPGAVTVKPIISGGTATIGTKDFEEATAKSNTNGTITVDMGTAHSVKLVLTEEQISSLKEKSLALTMGNDEVNVLIPASIVSEGKSFSIELDRSAEVSDAKSSVYVFTIIVDGKEVHQFSQPITLTFDVDLTKVTNTNDLKVYYYNGNTKNWELVPGAVYKDGKVIVKTSHFSKFAVFEVAGNQQILGNTASIQTAKLPNTSTNNYNQLLAGIAMIMLGSLFLFNKRRKHIEP